MPRKPPHLKQQAPAAAEAAQVKTIWDEIMRDRAERSARPMFLEYLARELMGPPEQFDKGEYRWRCWNCGRTTWRIRPPKEGEKDRYYCWGCGDDCRGDKYDLIWHFYPRENWEARQRRCAMFEEAFAARYSLPGSGKGRSDVPKDAAERRERLYVSNDPFDAAEAFADFKQRLKLVSVEPEIALKVIDMALEACFDEVVTLDALRAIGREILEDEEERANAPIIEALMSRGIGLNGDGKHPAMGGAK